jgi:predicted RNA methylase
MRFEWSEQIHFDSDSQIISLNQDKAPHVSQNINFKFIDLFAGIGGIRIPFDELGYRNVFSSEIDPAACKTYEANFGEKPYGDIPLSNEDLSLRFELC